MRGAAALLRESLPPVPRSRRTSTTSIASTPRSYSTFPMLRENWVLSLRGRLQTTLDDTDVVPYFLLPSLGSGSTLRGYNSWRFRDRHRPAVLRRMAMDSQPPGHGRGHLLRCRHRGGPRSTRSACGQMKSDVGIGVSFPRPGGDAAAHRVGQGQRRARSWCSRQARHSDVDDHTRPPRPGSWPRSAWRRSSRGASSAADRRFYDDDPLQREPESQDASKVAEWDIELLVDLTMNLFGASGRQDARRARRQHQHDRRGAGLELVHQPHRRAPGDDRRRPSAGRPRVQGPAPGRWTVIAPEALGVRARLHDARFRAATCGSCRSTPRDTPKRRPARSWSPTRFSGRSATGRSRTIWWRCAATSSTLPRRPRSRRTSGQEASDGARAISTTSSDAAHRGADGSYRAVAARGLPGRLVGGFRYYGTRPDDPNDVVPHEHRRELRALKVFGAWTNLVDMKAGNTLDTVVTENGRSVVRHYLQDVGSTFGTGANGPREYDEGWEYLVELDLRQEAFLPVRFSACSPGRRCTTPTTRRSAASKARVRSGDVEAARANRRVPARAQPTTPSGRRAAWRHSATR